MKNFLGLLAEIFPRACFRNWLRPHHLVFESVFHNGTTKCVCLRCGLTLWSDGHGNIRRKENPSE